MRDKTMINSQKKDFATLSNMSDFSSKYLKIYPTQKFSD